MPMKAMIYKTLSTVVDDFFAYDFFFHVTYILTEYNHTMQVLYKDAILTSFGLFPVCDPFWHMVTVIN